MTSTLGIEPVSTQLPHAEGGSQHLGATAEHVQGRSALRPDPTGALGDATEECRSHWEGGVRLAGIDSGALSVDPDIRFPGESDEYPRERNRLLEAEIDLRRAIEEVAGQRRALPPGREVPEDYRFEEVAGGGGEVRFSDLFSPGKDTLVIYSFMLPRYSGDSRPWPAGGQTARLPLVETPCPSCTSILDSLDGAAPHLAQRLNLAVVAKSAPERIRAFAEERGWRHLRLLSSRDNTYNRDTSPKRRRANRCRS